MNRSPAACAVLALALASAASVAQAGPLTFAGSLDVNLPSRVQPLDLNTLYGAETSFDGYHLRLDAQGQTASGLRAVVETRLSDAATPRVYAAYAMVTPQPEHDFHAIAGKMPWLIGAWGAREAPERQPLMGTPLMYQFPIRLPSDAIVPDADSLYRIEVATAGSSYGGSGVHGMRVVEDGWWDVGLGLMGSAKRLEYAFGVSNGTPGAPNPVRDVNSGKTALGRVGFAPLPGLRVGASGAYGAWLPEALDPQLPAGRSASDYHQRLVMADAEVMGGHAELRGEAFLNAWETPTLGTLRARGGYAEGKLTLAAGCYAAARYDLLRFSQLHESTGEPFPWNDDVDRIEAGVGYRPGRGTLLKLVWQRTTLTDGEETEREELVATQLVLVF